MHGKVAVKEKLIGQRTISFGVRAVASVSEGNNNEPAAKKARNDTSETEHSNNPDLNDSLVNYECNDCDYTFDNEMELRRHISTHNERVAVSNEELKQDIKAAKEEVLASIKNILKKKEVSEIDKKDKDDTSNILMKARSINDVLLSFPEFKRNEQKNVIFCELCVISIFNQHNSDNRKSSEEKLNDEMFVAWNGPEIGECDEILKNALDLHFKITIHEYDNGNYKTLHRKAIRQS